MASNASRGPMTPRSVASADGDVLTNLNAAIAILQLLWKRRDFESVVDIGCGLGAWLFAARRLGAKRLLAVDAQRMGPSVLLGSTDEFIVADLNRRFTASQRFDLCLCLQVAEYLHPGRSVTFVEDLTRLSDVVAFAAAIPHEGGNEDVNGAWPEQWAQIFSRYRYLPWCGLREASWRLKSVPWWYRQNIVLYVRESAWANVLPGEEPSSLTDLTRIHPEHYVAKCRVKDDGALLSWKLALALDAFYRHSEGKKSCQVELLKR